VNGVETPVTKSNPVACEPLIFDDVVEIFSEAAKPYIVIEHVFAVLTVTLHVAPVFEASSLPPPFAASHRRTASVCEPAERFSVALHACDAQFAVVADGLPPSTPTVRLAVDAEIYWRRAALCDVALLGILNEIVTLPVASDELGEADVPGDADAPAVAGVFGIDAIVAVPDVDAPEEHPVIVMPRNAAIRRP
jgi:hypothetical protein